MGNARQKGMEPERPLGVIIILITIIEANTFNCILHDIISYSLNNGNYNSASRSEREWVKWGLRNIFQMNRNRVYNAAANSLIWLCDPAAKEQFSLSELPKSCLFEIIFWFWWVCARYVGAFFAHFWTAFETTECTQWCNVCSSTWMNAASRVSPAGSYFQRIILYHRGCSEWTHQIQTSFFPLHSRGIAHVRTLPTCVHTCTLHYTPLFEYTMRIDSVRDKIFQNNHIC